MRAPASRLVMAISLVGMFAALGYGAYQVRVLDTDYRLKSDSLVVLSDLADSLRREVDLIRQGPLNSLITPKVLAVPAQRVQCPKE